MPRKFFNMIPQDKELEQIRNIRFSPRAESKVYREKPAEVDGIVKFAMAKTYERLRKALTSIKHYKSLKIDPMIIPKIREYLPGVPYGLPKSKEFLSACKEGNMEVVQAMIEKNKWLVHSFDNSGQAALHWAVKRNLAVMVKVLLQAGAWIDVADFVRNM